MGVKDLSRRCAGVSVLKTYRNHDQVQKLNVAGHFIEPYFRSQIESINLGRENPWSLPLEK